MDMMGKECDDDGAARQEEQSKAIDKVHGYSQGGHEDGWCKTRRQRNRVR